MWKKRIVVGTAGVSVDADEYLCGTLTILSAWFASSSTDVGFRVEARTSCMSAHADFAGKSA